LWNRGGCADGRIFNIGHPGNDCSIRELAELMVSVLEEFDGYQDIRASIEVQEKPSEDYYGAGYQDMQARRPDISASIRLLSWQPRVDLREALRRTVACYAAKARDNGTNGRGVSTWNHRRALPS
jgi:nucleoside-diphosphate-sugar epimerase